MSLFNPWVLLGILCALALSFVSGMRVQSDHTKAQLLAQERAMHEAYVGKVREYRAIAQQTSKELIDETIQRQADAVSFRDELRRARAQGVPLAVCPSGEAPGAQPRLTGEFGRLYDRAFEIGVPGPRDPERADAPAPRADPIDPADVLANHADNAEAWAECRSALRGWQTLARRYGWVK